LPPYKPKAGKKSASTQSAIANAAQTIGSETR
jgi:hypothetical protein